MSKVRPTPDLPPPADPNAQSWVRRFFVALVDEFRKHAAAINAHNDGLLTGQSYVSDTVPSAEEKVLGRFCRNSAPEVLGSAGSRYVVSGWRCVDDGAGNLIWVEAQERTGT